MPVKNTSTQNLTTHQQRLERLAQLCGELQAALEQAGDHRRLIEHVRRTMRELPADGKSAAPVKKRRRRD